MESQSSHGERIFLFLGRADAESAKSKLKTLGITYIVKELISSAANYKSMIKILRDARISGVAMKITPGALDVLRRDDYREVSQQIFEGMSKIPHIVFIHETYNAPISSPNSYGYGFETIDKVARNAFQSLLQSNNINVSFYKTNAELSMLASIFIDQSDRNLIFRVYVSKGKLWAEEAGRLFSLFRDYLVRVNGLDIRQEQFSTSKGDIYELYAKSGIDPETLPTKFHEFSSFLDLCLLDPEEAAKALKISSGSDLHAIMSIVDRYSKEARRLHIDLKHDRERKVLSIRHRMESELTDVAISEQQIEALIEAAIPKNSQALSALTFSKLPEADFHGSPDLDTTPRIAQSLTSVVSQEISGTQHFSAEAIKFLEAVRTSSTDQSSELASAVYILEDNEVKQEHRLSAQQKIRSFLITASGKLGNVALSIGQKYLESKLGL